MARNRAQPVYVRWEFRIIPSARQWQVGMCTQGRVGPDLGTRYEESSGQWKADTKGVGRPKEAIRGIIRFLVFRSADILPFWLHD